MAIFVVQTLGGLYQLGILASQRASHSPARASRLPDLLVFAHGVLGFLAAGLWVGQLTTGNDTFAWSTLGVIALAIAGGTVLFVKTEFSSETIDHAAADPAEVRVVEKRIPKTVLHGHGLGAAVLAVCVLLVAL